MISICCNADQVSIMQFQHGKDLEECLSWKIKLYLEERIQMYFNSNLFSYIVCFALIWSYVAVKEIYNLFGLFLFIYTFTEFVHIRSQQFYLK